MIERVTLWRGAKSKGPWQEVTDESQAAHQRAKPNIYEVRTFIPEDSDQPRLREAVRAYLADIDGPEGVANDDGLRAALEAPPEESERNEQFDRFTGLSEGESVSTEAVAPSDPRPLAESQGVTDRG